MTRRIRAIVTALELSPRPGGGWFRETSRSSTVVRGGRGPLSILLLLPAGCRTPLRRVPGEQLWLHHEGDPVLLDLGAEIEVERRAILGPGGGEATQALVVGGGWLEAEVLPGNAGFALVGCVVEPGPDPAAID